MPRVELITTIIYVIVTERMRRWELRNDRTDSGNVRNVSFLFYFFFLHNSIMELACALRGASVRLQMHEMLTSTRWNIWIVNTIQAHVGCWWWNMFICTVRTINQPYDGWDWENLSRWRRISLSVSTCFFHLDLSSSYRISKLFFFFVSVRCWYTLKKMVTLLNAHEKFRLFLWP